MRDLEGFWTSCKTGGQQQSPSIQEWRELYDAAREFKQVECWNWMWDTDLFGIQNPENGEVGYCCVMGRAGEHFALAVYSGTEGLETYQKLQRGFFLSALDAVLLQKCLMASFEDRNLLGAQDFQVIKSLGLKFRGCNSWTLFRSYLPGYAPWHLNREEAKFLTVALRQAIDVALRFKNDPELLDPPSKNQYLVRVSEKNGNGVVWKDEWTEPAPLKKEEIDTKRVDEDHLNRIKRSSPPRRGIWEIDFFYFPQAVWEKGERPYYPRAILTVDCSIGLILGCHLAEPENFVSEFREAFLELMESVEFIPEEVIVKRESVKLLEPITSKLEIKLRKAKRLPTLEKAQESFLYLLGDKRFM